MSDEMQKYNKAIEKVCAECAADVGKTISTCAKSVANRMGKLIDDIEKIPVPKSAGKDLEKVPALVVATLKKGGTRYASIADFGVKVNVSGNKVSVPAAGISGPLAPLVA
jgi:hypothetical protein